MKRSAIALLAFVSLPAEALNLPSTDLVSADLVTPSAAWAYYGSGTTHTSGPGATARPPEITALARGLGAERVGEPVGEGGITEDEYAQRVFDYVRNNIDVEFRFGLSKGARGAVIDQSAGIFDQAHLMVELLREAGITASYEVGTISLTAEEFGLWSGLVKNLNPATQEFEVDAPAACRLLADGGIPATVNGQGSCAGLFGNLPSTGTPIVMGHAWVLSGGKRYAPAYKQHRFRLGVDLAAAMNCGTSSAPTCGSGAATAAMVGSSSGSIGGSPSITNVNEANLDAFLSLRAQNLQGYVEANMVNAELIDLIGGIDIDRGYAPVPSASLPFPSTTQYSWSGDIPDQFRTAMRLRYAIFDVLFYADEIAGKRIRVLGLPQNPDPGWLLYLESLRIVTATCTTCSDVVITLDIDHPYAAASGDYADEQVDLLLLASAIPNVPPVTIAHGFGRAAPSTEQFYAQLQTVDPDPVFFADGFPKSPGPGFDPFCGGFFVHGGQLYEGLELCRNDSQPTMIAKTLAQGGVADRIAEYLGSARLLRHHAVGMVASQAHVPALSDLLSVQSSVSIVNRDGDAAERQTTFETISAAWAMLEGSVAQQISDTWMPDSPNGLIVMANRNSVPLIQVAAGNMSGVIPHLDDYDADRQARLAHMASEGYDAIVPRDGTPGEFVISGVTYDWLVGGSLFYRGDSLAYMVNEAYKGGAAANGPDAPEEAVLNSARAADYAVNARKFLTVSPGTGELALDPRPDVVTGAGDFPDSLPLQRRYRSDSGTFESMALVYGFSGTSLYFRRFWTYSGPDVNALAHLGSGWTHNFSIRATLGNNALKAMSMESALDSSAFIAGLFTLHDALRNPTFQRRLAAIFAAQWLNDRFIINAATADVAGRVEVFARLPDGSFNPPPGSASSLLQAGNPIGPRVLNPAGTVGYDYSPVTFVYTDRDGASIGFNWGTETWNDSGAYARAIFKPVTWTFPGGGRLAFAYHWAEVERSAMGSGLQSVYVAVLESVTNHLGRALEFDNIFRTVSLNPLRWVWLTETISDGSGRHIDYLPFSCPPLMNWPGEGSASSPLICNSFAVTTQDNLTTGYTYEAGADSPNPPWITRPHYRLRRTFVPSELTSPFQTLVFDDLFRVREVTDALARTTRYFTGVASMREQYNAAAVIDAEHAVWSHLFDQRGSLLHSTDPLDRTTEHEYDGVGRLVRTTNPEGDSVERSYDVRSNLLSATRKAKPGSSLPDLVASTSYVEGPGVKACSNLRTCNKPASTTDARGNTTDYEWHSVVGDLLQIRLPADSAGQRPQTDYGYTEFGPSGGEFRRLTSRTERIAPGQDLVTSYVYNPANHFVLQSATADPGGLGLTTGFSFDSVGNLTEVDGPRTDVVDTTHYVWDIHRRLTFEIGADPGLQPRPATRYSYDDDSQLVEVARGTATDTAGTTFSALERTAYDYDAVGNRIRENVMDGAGSTPLVVTQYSYDDVDRPDCTAVRMNPAVFGSLPADACTLSTEGSFGPDRLMRMVHDPAGQLLQEIRALGTPLQQDYATYTYTDNGRRATLEDANGNLSTQEYDGHDRLRRLRFPVAAPGAGLSSTTDFEEYSYDENDNLTSLRKRDGNVITYQYDNLNREIFKDIPGGASEDVHTRYDLLGRRLFARFSSTTGSGIDYTWDKAGRLVSESAFGRSLLYQHDQAGNRTRVTWPDSLYVEYTYDALNRMRELRENGATSGPGLLARHGYDDLGRRHSLERGNGVTTTWSYDGMSRLEGLGHADTDEPLTVAFAYNPASQIVHRSVSNDAWSWTGHSSGTTVYGTATGLNQYPSVGGDPYSYDDNGNLTIGGGRSRAYDVENRLVSITGTPNLLLDYDPLGRLHQTTAGATDTQFLYAGDDLAAEYDAGGNLTRRYVHGAGIDEPLVAYTGSGTTSRAWLLADERGSIIAETNASGDAAIHAYGPYGEPDQWGGQRFRYTGQIALPEAELYHYKARAYDPVLGRFLQTDPVGYDDGLNLYAYVANDPLNSADPGGDVAIAIPIWLIPVLGGAAVGAECAVDPSCREVAEEAAGKAIASIKGAKSPDSMASLPPTLIGPAVAIGSMLSARGGDESATDQVVGDLAKDGADKGRHVEVDARGGDQKSDFDRIVKASGNAPRPIETKYGPGQVVDLPGGGAASTRPGSSAGPGTIQINRPGSKPIKRRY